MHVGEIQRADDRSVLGGLIRCEVGDEPLVGERAGEAVDHERASAGAGTTDELPFTTSRVGVVAEELDGWWVAGLARLALGVRGVSE